MASAVPAAKAAGTTSPNRVRGYHSKKTILSLSFPHSLDIRRRMRYLQPFLTLIRVVLCIDMFEFALFSINIMHTMREPVGLNNKK